MGKTVAARAGCVYNRNESDKNKEEKTWMIYSRYSIF